jgi:hypothetical protein
MLWIHRERRGGGKGEITEEEKVKRERKKKRGMKGGYLFQTHHESLFFLRI